MVQSLGSVPLYGPGSVMIHVPKVHQAATALNDQLRRDSSLSARILELAMIVTAREMDCQHIWNAHAGPARNAGVPDALIDALREKKELPRLTPEEAAVINYGQEFFRTHRVSRGAFQAALEQFGTRGLVELTLTMGNYSLLAFAVNAFDTNLPPERSEPLLPG